MNIKEEGYRLMFMFLLRCRRMNEVLSLQWSDIKLDDKKYTIRAENFKGRKSMTFLLDDEIVEHIKILTKRTDCDGSVFKSKVTSVKMDYIPKKIMESNKGKCWSRKYDAT